MARVAHARNESTPQKKSAMISTNTKTTNVIEPVSGRGEHRRTDHQRTDEHRPTHRAGLRALEDVERRHTRSHDEDRGPELGFVGTGDALLIDDFVHSRS
jgi:hypothetical protein